MNDDLIIGLSGSVVAIIISIVSLYFSFILNKKLLKSQNTAEKRKEINKQLNEFYGPLQQLRNKSKHLYEIMVKDKKPGFRTLIALLEHEGFSENDRKLLEGIISIGQKTESLILEKSGLVDDSEFRELLGKATTHFVVIRKAYEKIITGDVNKFENYVFPRELDGKIEANIQKLKDELNKLNEI